MTTIDDQASEHEALYLAEALRYRKHVERNTGWCKNCETATPGAFCCPECREDHEARINFNRGRMY